MRRFAFRLENVLELRKHLEQEWEIRMARISGECACLRERIEELDRQRRSSLKRPNLQERLDIADYTARERYAERLLETISVLRAELAEREEERKKTGVSLLEASKKRKTLEKLRERRAEEFRREANRSEISVVDDIVQGMAARKDVSRD